MICVRKFIGIDQVCIRTTTARMEAAEEHTKIPSEKSMAQYISRVGSSITHFRANKYEWYAIMILAHTQLKCEINYSQMRSNCI